MKLEYDSDSSSSEEYFKLEDDDEQKSRKNSKKVKSSYVKELRYNIKQDLLSINNIQIPNEFENVQKSKSIFLLNDSPTKKQHKKSSHQYRKYIRGANFYSQSERSYSIILNVLEARNTNIHHKNKEKEE